MNIDNRARGAAAKETYLSWCPSPHLHTNDIPYDCLGIGGLGFCIIMVYHLFEGEVGDTSSKFAPPPQKCQRQTLSS